jgi:hypothetical protein
LYSLLAFAKTGSCSVGWIISSPISIATCFFCSANLISVNLFCLAVLTSSSAVLGNEFSAVLISALVNTFFGLLIELTPTPIATQVNASAVSPSINFCELDLFTLGKKSIELFIESEMLCSDNFGFILIFCKLF